MTSMTIALIEPAGSCRWRHALWDPRKAATTEVMGRRCQFRMTTDAPLTRVWLGSSLLGCVRHHRLVVQTHRRLLLHEEPALCALGAAAPKARNRRARLLREGAPRGLWGNTSRALEIGSRAEAERNKDMMIPPFGADRAHRDADRTTNSGTNFTTDVTEFEMKHWASTPSMIFCASSRCDSLSSET